MTTNGPNTNNESRPWEHSPKKKFVVELSEKLVRQVRRADKKFWGWEPLSISGLIEMALYAELTRLKKTIKMLEDREFNDYVCKTFEQSRQQQEWALLLSIADGIVDRQALKAKHWPDRDETEAEMALKGALKCLRDARHAWLEKGRSMALTEFGRQLVQEHREFQNRHGNKKNDLEADRVVPPSTSHTFGEAYEC